MQFSQTSRFYSLARFLLSYLPLVFMKLINYQKLIKQSNHIINNNHMAQLIKFIARSSEMIAQKLQSSLVQLEKQANTLPQAKSISRFLSNSSTKILDKLNKDVTTLSNNFAQWVLPPPSRRHRTENDSYSVSDNHPNRSLKTSKLAGKASRLGEIEAEKMAILKQLRQLDHQITNIKGNQKAFSLSRKRQSLQKEQEAKEAALKLVNRYKLQKKQKEDKKRKQTQRLLTMLKQSQQQFRKQLAQHQKKKKEDKRRQISIRLEDCRKKREERLHMDRQSNKLVAQILKQKQLLMQQSSLPEEIVQLEQKKLSMCEKKQDIDFKEIQEHERKYIAQKHREEEVKHQRGVSVDHPTQKYSKNMWASILQAQELRRKEELKSKEIQPKKVLDRRLKYGQLVKSIFTIKQNDRLAISREASHKPKTPDVHNASKDNITLPKISESQKRINETKIMKKYRENTRIETSPGNSKPSDKYRSKHSKSPEEKEKERIRDARMHELKRQTDQRLRRIDTQVHQVATPEQSEKPRYKNYLGTVKLKKKQRPKEWRKIIENTSLTEEERCLKMLKHAEQLELQAKKRQQIRSQSIEKESIELYINSIQAKLALLQKF